MNITEIFGSAVFGDEAMKAGLPGETYEALKKTIARGSHLELDVANVVAGAMKDWAQAKGVTHFTHWFQPMTGITAEKHESFLMPSGDGKAVTEFSGKALVRGEPDASSFPSGGLRATFEARGYTAWDPTSYAFIKGGTLCIPTAFCSHSGDALDKKTPLLRSVQAVNKQARRILRLFGNDCRHVDVMMGAEQEYFLIDKAVYLRRPDLIYCGRTLFGAKPPKGQELGDHYFGSIKPRVSAFMKELDGELWKLGVCAKIRHNESAPAQHELAPYYGAVNIAADHNQLMMELMRTVADRHGLACILHEKPFEGVNGSGKHINWSLATDTGVNLLEPGETPFDNAQFLLFLLAVTAGADKHQGLLRVSAASAGNDLRLGGDEAPPAIMSVFLGDELTEILTAIENDAPYQGREHVELEIGVKALPHFPKDATDRNRTSPFAFTGNKFEFRMPGSAQSVADSCMVINTLAADSLAEFADTLEGTADFNRDLTKLIKSVIKRHKRIIFNGNNYSAEWEAKAKKRGLPSFKTTVDALPCLLENESTELFRRQEVLSESELRSRFEVGCENYCKIIHIEALTMLELAMKELIPAAVAYQNDLTRLVKNKSLVMVYDSTLESKLLKKLAKLSKELFGGLEELEKAIASASEAKDYQTGVLPAMADMRKTADAIESIVGRRYLNLPLYGEMLYSVN